MVREIPEEVCQHKNEKVIESTKDSYVHTQIKCLDCGSVRMNGVTSSQKDLSHSETY